MPYSASVGNYMLACVRTEEEELSSRISEVLL
jgi:hypothetical protein